MTRKTLARVLIALRFYAAGFPCVARYALPKKFKIRRPILTEMEEWVMQTSLETLSASFCMAARLNSLTHPVCLGSVVKIRKPARYFS